MCPKCKHDWAEHRTTDQYPDEHECQVDASHIAAPLLVCGCMEIPPGHAPDWEVCEPCAAAR